MRVTSLALANFRSFAALGPIDLQAINVFIGANNSGKSTILRSLYAMQDGSGSFFPDVRLGSTSAQIRIGLTEVDLVAWSEASWCQSGVLTVNIASVNRAGGSFSMNLTKSNSGNVGIGLLPAQEPAHFIVPQLAKRKTSTYQEDVRTAFALQVLPNLGYLAAKLSRISNPAFPGYAGYSEACKAILGFIVTAIPSESGQRPGVYLPNRDTIPIDQMGEGVPNIVSLLADLALSENKLFLMEEPENDLHPAALKALLDLVVASSASNQFVVSTHSNIVLRHLGAAPNSLVYNVSSMPGQLPTEATVRLVEPTPEARLEVLRELGYSFSDFDLWDGWLILEESSAERIIRDYLIPWFAPKLSRVRTVATGGINQIEPTFDDFHRLVRFTHLEQAYTNAAWVRVDGDDPGKEVVQQLRTRYPSWSPDRFACFGASEFERYYPAEFQEQATAALAVQGRQQRREAKRVLLDEVRAWLDADAARARQSLSTSAHDVIADLRTIEAQVAGVRIKRP